MTKRDQDQRGLERAAKSALILELIVQGKALAEVLEQIVLCVESESPGVMCSILLLDALGTHLLLAAAPHLPTFYNEAIHGLAIGPTVGSCGTAAHTRVRVVVEDIATDPLWKDFVALAQAAGLASCWSEPILNAKGSVLGTFAIYHAEPMAPTPSDLELIASASRLASLAIERARSEEKLQVFQRALDEISAGVLLADAQTPGNPVIYVNHAFEKITGYAAEEVLGENLGRLVGTDRDQSLIKVLKENSAAGRETRGLFRNYRKDGTRFWNDYVHTPIRNAQGEVTHFVGIQNDVTQQKSFADALMASEARYRQIVETAEEGIWICDAKEQTQMVNAKVCQILGYSREELIGKPSLSFIHEADLAQVQRGVEQRHKGTRNTYVARFRHKQGHEVWAQIAGSPILEADGTYSGSLAMITDITEQRTIENRLQNVVTNLPGVLYQFELSPNGSQRMTYVSAGCEELWEIEAERALESIQVLWDQIDPAFIPHMKATLQESTMCLTPWNTEWAITVPSGRRKWMQVSAKPQRREDGAIVWDGFILDVTERRLAQEQIVHNSLHDPLTGLPNRILLMETLEQAIQRKDRPSHLDYALLFLDLDRFKVINDSLGHLPGDEILKRVAQILRRHLRSVDLVARFGGDEFVIVLEEVAGPEKILLIAERILRDFDAPFLLDDTEIFLGASIGIVLGSSEYTSAADAVRDADIAMYRAKAAGGGTYRLFDTEMHTRAVERLSVETELRRALEREDFVLHYQPIIDLQTDQLWGAEALVRLIHPTRGLIAPGEFIPVAEETGLIVALDHWVLRTACQQLACWNARFPQHPLLKISVNISAPTLRKPGFVRYLDTLLKEIPLVHGGLTLELTEGVLMENSSKTQELFEYLKAHNIRLSIDDFGTGFSSLSYLSRFPVDALKIDRSFVQQMGHHKRNFQLVSTVVTLSNQLGFAAVAEGIETPEQLTWLRQLGCEFGQGYLFARPLSVDQLESRFLVPREASGLGHEIGSLRKAA